MGKSHQEDMAKGWSVSKAMKDAIKEILKGTVVTKVIGDLLEADEQTRRLERKFASSGSPSDAERLLKDLMRKGRFRSNNLEEINKIGSVVAVAAIPDITMRRNALARAREYMDPMSVVDEPIGSARVRRNMLAEYGHLIHRYLRTEIGLQHYVGRIPFVRGGLGLAQPSGNMRSIYAADPHIGFLSNRWVDESNNDPGWDGGVLAVVCPEHRSSHGGNEAVHAVNVNPYYTACSVDGEPLCGDPSIVPLFYLPARFRPRTTRGPGRGA